MFNAQAARALAHDSATAPCTMLSVKTTVQRAAEIGELSVAVNLPSGLSDLSHEAQPSLLQLVTLLRKAGHEDWAQTLTQAQAAGYSVSALREPVLGASGAKFHIKQIRIGWSVPRQADAGALMLGAEYIHEVARNANQSQRWVQEVLREVQLGAALGRKRHAFRDALPANSSEWDTRLRKLQELEFVVTTKAISTLTEVTVFWG